MAINNIQVEFEKGGYASFWTGGIAPDRALKRKIWFLLNKLSLTKGKGWSTANGSSVLIL